MRRQPQNGFTLIEILVVMIVVGIMVSMAVMSFGLLSEDSGLDEESRRFAAILEAVQDDAMMQGREFGIEIMISSYRFVEFDPLTRQWAEVIGDDLYAPRSLSDGLEFELFIDEKRIPLKPDAQQIDDDDADTAATIERYAPHLFVFASGDSTVFEIHFWRPATDDRRILRGDILGNLEFGAADEI